MMPYVVNRWVDLADRVGWTFIQTFAGAWIGFGFDLSWDILKSALVAAAISAAKVTVAQRRGNPIGDLVPGKSVIES